MTLYDLSRRINPSTAVWPGDQPYTLTPALRIADGAAVNLMTLTMSPHTAAHADAPFHYEADGAPIADVPLTAYIGRARVVTVTRRSGPLSPSDLPPAALDGVQRLLIRSHVSDLPDGVWPDEFPYLSEALIAAFAAQGGLLIGLDSPSVDAQESKALPGHHALATYGVLNLECLNLAGVPDGDYELIALPLRLDGACASPVRAVLRPLEE